MLTFNLKKIPHKKYLAHFKRQMPGNNDICDPPKENNIPPYQI